MNIQLHGVDMEITLDIENYSKKKVGAIKKVISSEIDTAFIRVDMGKEIGGQKQGEIFKTDINLDAYGKNFKTSSTGDNLYKTIDQSVSEMIRVVKKSKGKKEALWKRGAQKVKKIVQGWRK